MIILMDFFYEVHHRQPLAACRSRLNTDLDDDYHLNRGRLWPWYRRTTVVSRASLNAWPVVWAGQKQRFFGISCQPRKRWRRASSHSTGLGWAPGWLYVSCVKSMCIMAVAAPTIQAWRGFGSWRLLMGLLSTINRGDARCAGAR